MPQFDVDGARKAGYSDDEIAAHLASSKGFDLAGARASGYSSNEIVSHLSGAGQRGMGSGRPQPVAPTVPPNDYGLSSLLPSGRTVAQMGGATAGGILGAPAGPAGAIGGAALGAGTGESLYQLLQHARGQSDVSTSGESAKQILGAGAGGALQEAIGQALPAAGRGLSKMLYRSSLKPSTNLSTKEATDIVDTLIKERIVKSPGGVRKLSDLVGNLGQDVSQQLHAVPGVELSPSSIAGRVDPTLSKYARSQQSENLAAAQKVKDKFLGLNTSDVPYSPYGHTQVSTLPPNAGNVYGVSSRPPVQTYQLDKPISALRAQEIKQGIYQDLGDAAYGSLQAGKKTAKKDLARGIRQELEAALDPATGQQAFPDIAALNARQGALVEAKPELVRAVNAAQNREGLNLRNLLTPTRLAGTRTSLLLDMLSRKQAGITPAALPRFATIPLLQQLLQSNDQ